MVKIGFTRYLVNMNIDPSIPTSRWLSPYRGRQLLLVKTHGRNRDTIIEVIAQWIIRGSFYLIAAGEWLPEHDELRYAVFRYTLAYDRRLDHLILSRPFTCLQLLDLLIEAKQCGRPVLIMDFLHLFHDADVDLSLRYSTLEQCCGYTRQLSLSVPVVVLVPDLNTEEYRRFFPLLASIADEIIETSKPVDPEAVQGSLF